MSQLSAFLELEEIPLKFWQTFNFSGFQKLRLRSTFQKRKNAKPINKKENQFFSCCLAFLESKALEVFDCFHL